MGYTKFGEFMRVQRIKHHEVMGDIATLLNVKVSFVSAVESGKKNVPEEWISKIIEHYHLSMEEQKELNDSVEESRTQVKMNLTSATSCQRRVALQFQRSFEEIDEDTAKAIIELLNRK